MSYLLETRGLSKVYRETGGGLEILKNVNFTLNEGSIAVLTGASGSGKSTFLNIVGVLDRPTSGSVFFEGKDMSKFSRREIDVFHRKKLGFMFQFHHLLSEFTALENVLMPAKIDKRDENESREIALELLNYVGLSDRAKHLPRELSGGERQRVALARALMNRPNLIIADEPSGNLDEKNAEVLKSLILKLNEKYNQAFLIATHDMDLAEIATHRWIVAQGDIRLSISS
ncbi:MAG: ABC transporter ATP-binding protein [Fibromonadaceae bacterium]|jgi:lipoprotein-releasing system ATP-binding protein|nr:ABC transporter ATP-binding protein [Fibromonadaceae bacterium]